MQAALAEARGALARSEADLARARQDVARYEPLVAQDALPREQLETAVAVQRAADAQVQAARAAVERVEIDLSYTKVLAPANGLAGKTEGSTLRSTNTSRPSWEWTVPSASKSSKGSCGVCPDRPRCSRDAHGHAGPARRQEAPAPPPGPPARADEAKGVEG